MRPEDPTGGDSARQIYDHLSNTAREVGNQRQYAAYRAWSAETQATLASALEILQVELRRLALLAHEEVLPMRPANEKPAERGEPVPGRVEGWEVGDHVEFLPTTEQAMSGRETRGVISRIFGGKHATIHVDIPHGDRDVTILVSANRAEILIRKLDVG